MKPFIVIVLGSGLGEIAEQVSGPTILPYDEIPGFPRTSISGHAGQIVFGHWGKKSVAVLQGRFHAYEGRSPQDVAMPVRVMQYLGVSFLLLTNAAGGIDPVLKPGDLMVIRDHIGLWSDSPLRGLNLDEFGPRFPDQTKVYDQQMGDLAVSCLHELGIPVHEGIYAYCKGPQFETPAEIRSLKTLGASAVGMSTVPEAVAAAHGGMRTLAISCITNFAAGLSDQPLSHAEVLEAGEKASLKFIELFNLLFARL